MASLSRCTSPHSIDGIMFGVVTWLTSRISTVQVGQTVLDRYTCGFPLLPLLPLSLFSALSLSLLPQVLRPPSISDLLNYQTSLSLPPSRLLTCPILPTYVTLSSWNDFSELMGLCVLLFIH